MADVSEAICLLHPPKTGGTYLKSVLQHNRDRWTRDLLLPKHRATAASTAKKHGATSPIAFCYRDPSARFVSAFYSRLRQGRPTYQNTWSAEEAVAFSWFATPTELAEGLGDPDPRTQSAAIFAFNAIAHIRRGYGHYFGDLTAFEAHKPRVVGCLDLADFSDGLTPFLQRLGVEDAEIPDGHNRHDNPAKSKGLSDKGEEHLRQFCPQEYDFYRAFQDLSRERAGG